MDLGCFGITKNNHIVGKFDQEKYDALNLWQRLKYKFSYSYRCEFVKPINCITIKETNNPICDLKKDDFVIIDSNGDKKEPLLFESDGKGKYAFEFYKYVGSKYSYNNITN